MVAIRFVSLCVMLAVVAFVTAIPAPQFQQPRQVAPGPQPKNINPDAEQLEGSNDEKDLKASASYGYGYYGGYPYGGIGYGYPSYSYSYGYPSYGFGYYGHSYPYYRGYGGLYGGYYY
ncbi:shematrin-like protein 1 [Bradysia coprophila]|uniref:shematrin-like protein 1 n=1 Tax=Bradysia coprophila TaxID=38358 RepID=UPI00187DB611|nr:shematrin-like protein 1 [Bradysia coprophila]